VVSTVFGLVCRVAIGETGWKTAIMESRYERVIVLLLRSFLVTLALEAWILLAHLGKEKDPRELLKATVAANLASYAVLAACLLFL
jgi:hypothetical protein